MRKLPRPKPPGARLVGHRPRRVWSIDGLDTTQLDQRLDGARQGAVAAGCYGLNGARQQKIRRSGYPAEARIKRPWRHDEQFAMHSLWSVYRRPNPAERRCARALFLGPPAIKPVATIVALPSQSWAVVIG